MGVTLNLIISLSRQKHPLGRPVHWDEVAGLIESLQNRLGAKDEELDRSPTSLKRLEIRLIKLAETLKEHGHTLNDEELVNLVREIVAYCGEVLVNHAGGRYYNDALHLLDNRIKFVEPFEIIDEEGGKQYKSRSVNFMIGHEAAWAWDTIISGGKPNLYKMYLDAKSKTLRERL